MPTFTRKLFSVSAFSKARSRSSEKLVASVSLVPVHKSNNGRENRQRLRELFILREHNNVFAQKSEGKKLMSYYRRCCARTAAASNSIFSLFSVVKVFNSPRTKDAFNPFSSPVGDVTSTQSEVFCLFGAPIKIINPE